jgi:hypothetical protein
MKHSPKLFKTPQELFSLYNENLSITYACAVHFWIGDWLNYGEQKWGEMYTQALDATEFDYGTLRDDKWISSKIQLSDRSDNLAKALLRHHYLQKLKKKDG